MNVLVRIYVLILATAVTVALALALPGTELDAVTLAIFVTLTALFFLSEFADVYFHDRSGGRWGISLSEALLAPMIVALEPQMVSLGVMLAIGIERIARRLGLIKTVFNIASFGLSAGSAAWVWRRLADEGEGFSVRNALALVLAVLVMAALTHVFTVIAIALSESGNLIEISRAVASTTVQATGGAILVGLFFTASFLAARWTVALFPPAFIALYLGNRAIVRQRQERDRLEHLHAASRVLAGAVSLEDAVTHFLKEIQKMVSASEASAFISLQQGPVSWHVLGDEVVAEMSDADHDSKGAFNVLATVHEAVVLREDEPDRFAEVRQVLGAKTAVVVPLVDSGARVGVLALMNRVGAGEFEEDDARLLEALANELVVSLSSFKLFAEVVEERERFGRIFSGSKEGICLIDGEGCVKAWNPALERITGYSSDQMLDRRWSDVMVVRDAASARLVGDEIVGVDPDEELEIVTSAGPARWVTVIAGPVGEAEDGGWVLLVRDVTAEHEVETAKSDFLSTISHELRTPLTTIKGSLQVLGRGQDNLPKELAEQMIGVTTRGAERLERLVMNLLAVSQIESGTMPVFPDEVSLDALVRDKVETMLKGHERVVIEGTDGELKVKADRERVGHAVEHLLENAVKFGGPQGEIRIELAKDKGYGRVSVSDEGPGIPVADRERIFERFIRLGDVLTRETQGAGVGLFIAARSIEAMGGRIWVESEVGQGSTFHLTVPLTRPMVVEDQADTA